MYRNKCNSRRLIALMWELRQTFYEGKVVAVEMIPVCLRACMHAYVYVTSHKNHNEEENKAFSLSPPSSPKRHTKCLYAQESFVLPEKH